MNNFPNKISAKAMLGLTNKVSPFSILAFQDSFGLCIGQVASICTTQSTLFDTFSSCCPMLEFFLLPLLYLTHAMLPNGALMDFLPTPRHSNSDAFFAHQQTWGCMSQNWKQNLKNWHTWIVYQGAKDNRDKKVTETKPLNQSLCELFSVVFSWL